MPANRTAFLLAGAAAAVGVMVLASALVFFPPSGSEAGTRDFSFEAQPASSTGFSISVVNVNGGIRVFTWAEQKVLVNGTITTTGFGANPDDVQIDQAVSSDGISVRIIPPTGFFFFGPQYDVPVSVYVPAGQTLESLHLETVNGVLNLGGPISSNATSLSTVNGEIQFAGISGNGLSASTVNGGISGHLGVISEGRTYSLSTTNGGVSLSVPSGSSFRLTMSTTNGDVSASGFTMTNVSQMSQHRITATVGDAASTAQVKLGTVNGDVDLIPS